MRLKQRVPSYIYISFVGLSTVGFLTALIYLLSKYSLVTTSDLLETCRHALTIFFQSKFHWIGISLLIYSFLFGGFLTLRLLFSLIKTAQRINLYKLNAQKNLPKKITRALEKHHIARHQVILTKHAQSFAYTIGFFSPQIVLSTAITNQLTQKRLEAVLLHELYHANHFHGLIISFGEILSNCLPLFPILKDVIRRVRLSFEYEADAYATFVQASSLPLKSTLRMYQQGIPKLSVNLGFASDGVSLRQQTLETLVPTYTPFSLKRVVVSIVAVFILLSLVLVPTTLAHAEAYETPNSRGHCPGLLQCSKYCKQDAMQCAMQCDSW